MKSDSVRETSSGKPSRIRARVIEMPVPSGMPSVPVEAAMSLLKETRGALTWTTRDMVNSLKIRESEATTIIHILVLQGYVKKSSENGEWITTIAGETVCGSKPPRFALARIEKALADLHQRIKSANSDLQATFRVLNAVAFGDFLLERPLVQAADVGVTILSKHGEPTLAAMEREIMRALRSRSPVLQLRPYRPWMSQRTNRSLL